MSGSIALRRVHRRRRCFKRHEQSAATSAPLLPGLRAGSPLRFHRAPGCFFIPEQPIKGGRLYVFSLR